MFDLCHVCQYVCPIYIYYTEQSYLRELYPSSARCKSAMAEIVFPFSIESPAFFPQTPPRRLFVLCRRGHGRCGCGGHHLAVPVHPGLDMGRYGQILTGGGGWAAPGPGMRPALRMGMNGNDWDDYFSFGCVSRDITSSQQSSWIHTPVRKN